MKTKPLLYVLIFVISLLGCVCCFGADEPQAIDMDKYIIYIPSGISDGAKCPLVIGFSPEGDAKGIIELWKDIAEKHKLVIAASKEFSNGVDPHNAFSTMAQLAREPYPEYQIDKTRVITSGVSGGGMAAHMFSVSYPDLTWAVISNCGRIHPDYIEKESFLYARNKLAVFLASTEDFNYGRMKGDQRFLEGLGWKTKWIEFQGGHMQAPKEYYEEAITWLSAQG